MVVICTCSAFFCCFCACCRFWRIKDAYFTSSHSTPACLSVPFLIRSCISCKLGPFELLSCIFGQPHTTTLATVISPPPSLVHHHRCWQLRRNAASTPPPPPTLATFQRSSMQGVSVKRLSYYVAVRSALAVSLSEPSQAWMTRPQRNARVSARDEIDRQIFTYFSGSCASLEQTHICIIKHETNGSRERHRVRSKYRYKISVFSRLPVPSFSLYFHWPTFFTILDTFLLP